MLIKWIQCEVGSASQKQKFSIAQEQWKQLHGLEGFLGQAGGWNQNHPFEACIISFWENHNYYKHFMEHVHDRIFIGSKQNQTYESISVNLFTKIFDKNDKEIDKNDKEIIDKLIKYNFLHVVDRVIDEGKKESFEQKQKDLWYNGMSNSNGFLGGILGESLNDSNHFLSVSIWENVHFHQKYAEEQLTLLKSQASVNEDLKDIVGKFVELEKSWNVI